MPTLRQENKEIYWAWKAMKQRCLNPRCQAYRNYGGRGIKVCTEWMTFEPFLDWCLSNGWKKGLDLDRRDNNGWYTPLNCRFVERRRNINNRRVTRTLVVDSKTMPITEWARMIGVNRHLIYEWIDNHGEKYASDRVSEAIRDGYTPKDYSRNHRKKVVLVEKGIVFNTVSEAANYAGIAPCALSTIIHHKDGKTKVGTFVLEI